MGRHGVTMVPQEPFTLKHGMGGWHPGHNGSPGTIYVETWQTPAPPGPLGHNGSPGTIYVETGFVESGTLKKVTMVPQELFTLKGYQCNGDPGFRVTMVPQEPFTLKVDNHSFSGATMVLQGLFTLKRPGLCVLHRHNGTSRTIYVETRPPVICSSPTFVTMAI